MYRSRQRQQGAIMMIMVVVIMVIGLTFLVSKTGQLLASVGKRFSVTNNTQNQIQKALISFAATYQRLPCPADPTGALNPGWPDGVQPLAPPAGSTCAFPAGVVPWNALGLSQEQVTDEWGRLISYRVYDGSVGLTQDKGASALNCDTDNQATLPVEPTIAGLCNNQNGKHDTLRSHFITYTTFGATPSFDKGLKAQDFGANVNNLAFVLISHGPSGLGGYAPNGTRSAMPAADTRDYPNTQASPAFFISQPASAADIAPGTTGHYDDVVTYLSIADLLKLASQDARDWPEASMPSFSPSTTANMTSPSTDPANPHFMTSGASGQGFTAVTQADGVVTVQAGGGTGSYSSCLWWPMSLNLISGTTRTFIAASVEFAAVDNSGDRFPGFTLGFLSGTDAAGPPTNNTCGTSVAATTTATNTVDPKFIDVASTSGILVGMNVYGTGIDTNTKVVGIVGLTVELDKSSTATVGSVSFANSRLVRRDLGWAGGTLASYSNRFAVEFDANTDIGFGGPPVVPSANDPSRPHLAVDFGGVTHGTDAAPCTTTGSGLPCDSEVTNFPTVTRTATGTAGQATITVTDASGIAGIVHGMTVSGPEIGSGAYVTAISGSVLTLSTANLADFSGSITFNSISTSNFMQNGLTVFHNARVEVSPRDCVAPTGAGIIGSTSITVSSNSGIAYGMSANGVGIASGATVIGVSGTTVTLSAANSTAVSGTIVFGGNSIVSTSATGTSGLITITVTNPNGVAAGMSVSGTGIATGATVQSYAGTTVTLSAANTGDVSGAVTFTPVSALTRTLIKTWTLSNAGCNTDPTICATLKNTSAKFITNISANRQAMQAVSCVPASSVANAYDSLYFGITTANRDNNGTATTNVIFRGLSVQTPLLP